MSDAQMRCAICDLVIVPGEVLIAVVEGVVHQGCAERAQGERRPVRPRAKRQPDALAHTSFPRRRRRGCAAQRL